MRTFIFILFMLIATTLSAKEIDIILEVNTSGGLHEIVNGIKRDGPRTSSSKYLIKQDKNNPVTINAAHDIHYYWLIDYIYYIKSIGFTDIVVKTHAGVPSNAKTRTMKEFIFRVEK